MARDRSDPVSVDAALDLASNKAAGDRPTFLHADAERVLAVTMAVAQELAVTRERLDTVERLLARAGILDVGDIATFEPDGAIAAARSLWMQEFLVRILRVVQQEGEAAAETRLHQTNTPVIAPDRR